MDIVVAKAHNDIIGRDGALPWHLPPDLKYFKELTMNQIIVMGRKTLESLPFRLPNREIWYLSNDKNYMPPFQDEYVKAITMEELLQEIVHNPTGEFASRMNSDNKKIFCIGGASIFQQVYLECEKLYITQIMEDIPGDTYLHLDLSSFKLESATPVETYDNLHYSFEIYTRHKD